MSDRARQLARAYGYPFPPAAGDHADPVPPRLPDDRVAILAFGANASRAVLAAKLGAAASEVIALEAEVRDADVVYSAHVSPYGSIPATLHHAPGTLLRARLLLVEPAAVPALDATEPNYVRESLDARARVEVPGLGPVAAQTYRSRHGPLHLDAAPVALAAVRAEARRLAAREQRDVQRALRDLLEPGAGLEDFTLAAVRDPAVRTRRSAQLRALGEPARASGGPG